MFRSENRTNQIIFFCVSFLEHVLFSVLSLPPHLVLLVVEAAALWAQAKLLCCQPVSVLTKAGYGHGRHQDSADAGHGHEHGKHPAGARLDSGGQG